MDERLMERDFGQWSGKLKMNMYDHLRNLNININDPMVSLLSDEIETWTSCTSRKRFEFTNNSCTNHKSKLICDISNKYLSLF